jgi:hypothetical protein
MSSLTETIFDEPIYLLKEKTWVILSENWSYMTAEDKELLQKILTAIGQRLESVTIHHQPDFDLRAWPQKPSRLIYFGPAPAGLPQNEIISVDGASVILAPTLAALQTDAAVKAKLWQSLKSLFKG